MDRQTMHRTIRTHRPRRPWWLLGPRRCHAGCGPAPCNTLITAIDQRDQAIAAAQAQAAIQRITDLMVGLRDEAHDALTNPLDNAGHWR